MTNCFYHEDRAATRALNVPCAPGGKVWVCEECHAAAPDSELRRKLFERYFAQHEERVQAKRVDEERRKGNRN